MYVEYTFGLETFAELFCYSSGNFWLRLRFLLSERLSKITSLFCSSTCIYLDRTLAQPM